MISIIKDSIEYSIQSYTAPKLSVPAPFKLFNIQRSIHIPHPKTDAGKILKVKSDVAINDTRAIRTAEAISHEGQVLTGKKLIVEGNLIQIIEYAEETPLKSLNAIRSSIPFSTHVTFPKNIKSDVLPVVSGFIQDISCELLDKRTIFESAIILISMDY